MKKKMFNIKEEFSSLILDYISITLGVSTYSMALAFLLLPYKLTSGGVTGIGTLIFYATGFEVQNSYFIINILLLLIAVKELGWRFCMKTIYATVAMTFTLWAAQRIYHWVGSPMIVGDEMFMATIIGAIISGTGLALCFMAGGSTGGTDIIAAIVNKYRSVSLGKVIMFLDIFIISSCYLVFHDIQKVMFGYVLLIVASQTLDYWLNKNHQSVEFKIYSRNPYLIAETIIKTGHGATILDGKGCYTNSERKVIISVVNQSERLVMFRMIKSIDPYAFVTMGLVSGVWGEGFDAIKVRDSKETSKLPILVIASTDENQIEEVRQRLHNRFQIRSLHEIGCEISHPIHQDILSTDALTRARCIKYYYGYDCIARDLNNPELPVILITGKAAANDYKVQRFARLEELYNNA